MVPPLGDGRSGNTQAQSSRPWARVLNGDLCASSGWSRPVEAKLAEGWAVQNESVLTSGKTTTLVARIAWLVDGGVPPATIGAITFNKRAAEELSERLDQALGPIGARPGVGPRADLSRARSGDPAGRRRLGRKPG